MNINGINRLKASFTKLFTADNRKSNERDADGRRPTNPQTLIKHLSTEQENEALEKFNFNLKTKGTGLKAEIIRGPDISTHVLVKNATGEVIRRLGYEQIVQLYLDRNNDNAHGTLFKSAA